jgi:glutaredoxin
LIKIIGTQNCSRCNIVKNILKSKNIEFEYILFDILEEKEKQEYMKFAEENNIKNFPIIIKNNIIIEDIRDVF